LKKGIIAKQFRDLKFGDRFYYENGNDNLIKFTTSQLDEIRKSNMARVLCDNVEITYIQKNPFLKADLQLNPLINCDLVDDIDYNLWKSIYTY
jgi:peroxidase